MRPFTVFLAGLSLASVIGIVDSTSGASAVLGILICLVFNYIQTAWMPYKKDMDNSLAINLNFSLTLIFLAALMISAIENGTDNIAADDRVMGLLLVSIVISGPIVIFLNLSKFDVKQYCWSKKARMKLIFDDKDPKRRDAVSPYIKKHASYIWSRFIIKYGKYYANRMLH